MKPGPTGPRTWVWLHLLLAWLPVLALYTLLVSPVNPLHRRTPVVNAVHSGLLAVGTAALLGFAVQRLTLRIAWPHPFRAGFVGIHLLGAAGYSFAWLGLRQAIDVLIHQQSALVFHELALANLVLGVWLYVMVAGVSYATQATERAARAEASAARSQLTALRGQLNPHFLFNALHTVVQLIPRDPRQAAHAAEQIAGLLRTTLEEDRDVVTLAEERGFVERYLDLERTRFGDRLRVSIDTSSEADAARLPSFSLQTLVENAVRHGAAPRVEPTDIVVEGRLAGSALILTVRDSGVGLPALPETNGGTGLERLRERLVALYDGTARLTLENAGDGGCLATLIVPQEEGD
jgi:sensor histidine kinase YesM